MRERILVVDDDPDIARFMELTLTKAGYEVAVVHDGREALERVRAERPELVLLDLMLPSMDGFEVARELRRQARLAGTAIVVVTARGLSEDLLRALALGVDDYVVKPFEPQVLLVRVRGVLRRLRDMRSLSPLTGLPGTVLVEEEIRRHLSRGEGFALLYTDLDHFKALNDTKGWDVGNRVILMAADVLEEAVGRFAAGAGFVGHIGGDDFAVLVPPEAAEETARWICARFDEGARAFYGPEELARGGVEAIDRRGNRVVHPLVAISIGVATTAVRRFSHLGEVVAVATEMKQAAKRTEGSCYAIDRRSG